MGEKKFLFAGRKGDQERERGSDEKTKNKSEERRAARDKREKKKKKKTSIYMRYVHVRRFFTAPRKEESRVYISGRARKGINGKEDSLLRAPRGDRADVISPAAPSVVYRSRFGRQ